MGFSSIIILIVLLVIALIFIRRIKRRDTRMNRYRHYTQQSVNLGKARRNRYNRPSRREPQLDYKSDKNDLPPPVQTPKPEPESVLVDPIETGEMADDPDVVLGLKEPPRQKREQPIPTEAQITLKPPPPPPPIFMFHIMAEEDNPYNGYELMQAILSVGMRFGDHQIFHRHEDKNGRGKILFSLASVMRPGTFDLHKMGSFSTPGLSLFFCASDVEDPIAIYELMLQTSGQLVEDMNGHVLDESRHLLTPAKVVEQRQQLRQYMECQQVLDLFEE